MKGNLGIPKISPPLFPANFAQLTMIYFEFLEKTEIGQEITERVENHAGMASHIAELAANNIAPDSKMIAAWFAWLWNEQGESVAMEALVGFLSSDSKTSLFSLWLTGLEVEEPLELDNGVRVVPVDDMPPSSETFQFTSLGSMTSGPNQSPKCALVLKKRVPRCGEFEPGVFRQVMDTLHDVAYLINGLDGKSCTPNLHSQYAPADVPYGPLGGAGGGWQDYDKAGSRIVKLEKSEIPTLNECVRAYSLLPQPDKDRLDLILMRMRQAKQSGNVNNKILDLGVAMEMLLLDDNSGVDQLSLTFRLRGSWLLGKNADDRRSLFEHLKDLYTFRSKVAHIGSAGRKQQELRDRIDDFLSTGDQVLRKILLEGNPDWTRLIMGGDDERS